MNARERYYLNHHLHRLMLWQIAIVEREIAEQKAKRRESIRALRQAYRSFKLGINRVRRANVEYYNRQIAKGF